MPIKRSKQSISKKQKLKNKLYCLVDGVLTPMVYQDKGEDGLDYYNDLMVSSPKRTMQQSASFPRHSYSRIVEHNVETTTTTPQAGTVTTHADVTIKPVFLFDYSKQVVELSDKLATWKSCYGAYTLSNGTSNLAPKLGKRAGGVNDQSSIYFDGDQSTGDYLSSSANITLSGDFTIFIYFTIEQEKYVRFVGKASDANVYISFNDDANMQFHFGLASSKTYTISMGSSTLSRDTGTLVTVQRSGTTLYLRKDGLPIGSTTIATDDLVIDQVGRIGTSSFTFGGNIHYMSGYDGYISTKLKTIEDSIITHSEKATL